MANTSGKKPLAPSVTERPAKADLKVQIVQELNVALDLVGADDLRDIIGNWRETLSDENVLAALKARNAKRRRPH
jgi:hypothetical protein